MSKRAAARQLFKQALWWTRVKIIYTRITLTRYTTFYFFFALLGCIVQVILQGIAFADNSEAASIISSLLGAGNITNGLAIRHDGVLQLCWNIPDEPGADCSPIISTNLSILRLVSSDIVSEVGREVRDDIFKRDLEAIPHFDPSGRIDGVHVGAATLDTPCLQSLLWLADILRDARREDIITMAFQIWLFTLAIVTILNESLPHLCAALFGHVLGTGWAAYRIFNSMDTQRYYNQLIVNGTCNQIDLLGPWWTIRNQHTYPVLVFNVVALVSTAYLSLRLFKVYTAHSFIRVGGSVEMHKIYRMVLVLSVCLQLAGFFTLGATGMWIDKISSGTIRKIARHLVLYTVAFALIAALEIPWVTLGWLFVRRENRVMSGIFCFMSVLLFVVSTLLWFSPLYRFVFQCWPFFRAMVITAYVLIIATSAMGVVCRLNFGKGLSRFLKLTEDPEGADFTPVTFSDGKGWADEKSANDELFITNTLSYATNKESKALSVYAESRTATIKLSTTHPVARDSPFSTVEVKEPRAPPRTLTLKRSLTKEAKAVQRAQVVSVYSDSTRETVKISTTPEFLRESPLTRTDSGSSKGSQSTYRSSSLRRSPPGIQKDARGRGLPSNPRTGLNVGSELDEGVQKPRGNYF